MQKIHVRLSVEVEVPDKTFKKIVDDALMPNGSLSDTEVSWLKDFVDFDTAKPVLEGWDDGGYIPGNWLEFDAIESGLYEIKSTVDDRGLMHDRIERKENEK